MTTDDPTLAQTPSPSGEPSAAQALPPIGRARTTKTTKTARNSAIAVGIISVLLIVVLAQAKGGEKNFRNQFLGRDAPAVEGVSMLDASKSFSLKAQRGKFVVINFFATWCAPCRKEHPELVALEAAHAAKNDLAIASVVYQDEVNDVRDFFTSKGGNWPVIDSSRIAVDWGVRGVPETYVISPAGVVIYQNNGGVTKEAVEAVLARAQGSA